jgi:hypothetical protein
MKRKHALGLAGVVLVGMSACEPARHEIEEPVGGGRLAAGASAGGGGAATAASGQFSTSAGAATTGATTTGGMGLAGTSGLGGQSLAGVSGQSVGGASFAGASGAAPTSRCPVANASVCVDFEGENPLAKFAIEGDDVAVTQAKQAHGQASLMFSKLAAHKSAVIATTQLDGISNVLWGRFYLYLDAGAPDGHGAFVNAFDRAGNWYELGFQFGAFHGNWHPPQGVPERWMNSASQIRAQAWTCVEFLFDGAKPAETQIWSDGALVEYTQKAGSPAIETVSQFERVTVGFTAYHGTSLSDYQGDTAPRATEMYLDDFALGAERIGCD